MQPFSPLARLLAAIFFSSLVLPTRAADIPVTDRKLLSTDNIACERITLGEPDDGFEFDFAHDRVQLDTRTPVGKFQGSGFGPTLQLDDGTLVTSYSYRGSDDKTHLEVVRWYPPARR